MDTVRVTRLGFGPAVAVDRAGFVALIVGTTAGATFATILAGGSSAFETLSLRLIYDVGAAVVLVPWLVVAAVSPSWRPASRLGLAIAACLGVFAISTATSRIPRLSIEALGYAVLVATLYLFLVALMRRPQLRAHFERLGLVLCLVVCGLYLVEVGLLWAGWWLLLGHPAIPPLRPGYVGLSMSPDPVATVAFILGAFALATTQLRGRRGVRIALLIVLPVAVASFITGSRGAWLGAAAALVVTGATVSMAEPGIRAWATAIIRSRRGMLGGLAGVGVLVLLALVAAHSGRLSLGDDSARAAYWAASFRMFGSAPLTGIGPGVWPVLRAVYTLPGDLDLYIPHAHDVFIQTLAEFGALGVLAGTVVVLTLGALIVRALRDGDRRRRVVAYAAVFAIVLLAIQQLVDMLLNVPAVLLAIALPVAWLDATSLGPAEQTSVPVARKRHDARRWLALGMAGAIVAVTAGLVRIEGVSNIALAGTNAADSGDWQVAAADASIAATQDPSVVAYQFQWGLAAANAGRLGDAVTAFSTSASADDYTYAWLNLAAVRWRLGQVSAAGSALAEAEVHGWQRADVALAAGWLRQQLGDVHQAILDYGAALAAQPTLAADPFWSQGAIHPIWSQILSAGSQAAKRNGGNFNNPVQTQLAISLMAGLPQNAELAAHSMSASTRSVYNLVIPAWLGQASAQKALADLAIQRDNSLALIWSALISAHEGDWGAAWRFDTLISIASPSAADANGHLMRIEFATLVPPPSSVLDRYGSAFRRQMPTSRIINLLPQVTYASGG
jgi:O-antigen ligase/tetratricopeptide (TPR) repeat protein